MNRYENWSTSELATELEWLLTCQPDRTGDIEMIRERLNGDHDPDCDCPACQEAEREYQAFSLEYERSAVGASW